MAACQAQRARAPESGRPRAARSRYSRRAAFPPAASQARRARAPQKQPAASSPVTPARAAAPRLQLLVLGRQQRHALEVQLLLLARAALGGRGLRARGCQLRASVACGLRGLGRAAPRLRQLRLQLRARALRRGRRG